MERRLLNSRHSGVKKLQAPDTQMTLPGEKNNPPLLCRCHLLLLRLAQLLKLRS